MFLVAIYCRISVEDGLGEESESIKNQKILLSEYAKNQGWDIYKIYEDEDYSGLREDRPAFLEMLSDAKEGKFDIILCKTQSRFTRSVTTAERLLHEQLPLWGIRFVSIIDGVDTLKKENKKARQINSLVNEWYCEELSDNIRAVLKKKREMGEFLGNYAPFGYEKDPQNKHRLIILEHEAKIVKYIAKLYLKGLSFSKIAEKLNLENIKTPTEFKQERGLDLGRKTLKKWRASTVRKILINPVYIGDMVQGREEKLNFKSKKTIGIKKEYWICVKNTHEAILSKTIFVKIQKLIEKNKKGQKNIDKNKK